MSEWHDMEEQDAANNPKAGDRWHAELNDRNIEVLGIDERSVVVRFSRIIFVYDNDFAQALADYKLVSRTTEAPKGNPD